MLARIDARLLVILGALLFSTGGAAIKATTFNAWQVAGLRSGIACVALILLIPSARRAWSWRVFVVAAAYAATLTLFVLANKLTTAANTIFLQSTAPLYLLVLSPLLLGERLARSDWWFVITLAAGLSMLFFSLDVPSATAPAPLLGNVLGAITGVTWACTLLGLRWLAVKPGAGTPAAAAAAGNLLAFFACAWWAFPIVSAAPLDWALVLYLGVFQIGIAYAFVTAAMQRVTALEASLLILLEPVLNPLWAWLFVGETPAALALGAGAVILTATAARTLQQRRQPSV